jgi:hypothetical protein
MFETLGRMTSLANFFRMRRNTLSFFPDGNHTPVVESEIQLRIALRPDSDTHYEGVIETLNGSKAVRFRITFPYTPMGVDMDSDRVRGFLQMTTLEVATSGAKDYRILDDPEGLHVQLRRAVCNVVRNFLLLQSNSIGRTAAFTRLSTYPKDHLLARLLNGEFAKP